eukprot:2388157-Rhodomonas_salina.1
MRASFSGGSSASWRSFNSFVSSTRFCPDANRSRQNRAALSVQEPRYAALGGSGVERGEAGWWGVEEQRVIAKERDGVGWYIDLFSRELAAYSRQLCLLLVPACPRSETQGCRGHEQVNRNRRPQVVPGKWFRCVPWR